MPDVCRGLGVEPVSAHSLRRRRSAPWLLRIHSPSLSSTRHGDRRSATRRMRRPDEDLLRRPPQITLALLRRREGRGTTRERQNDAGLFVVVLLRYQHPYLFYYLSLIKEIYRLDVMIVQTKYKESSEIIKHLTIVWNILMFGLN